MATESVDEQPAGLSDDDMTKLANFALLMILLGLEDALIERKWEVQS